MWVAVEGCRSSGTRARIRIICLSTHREQNVQPGHYLIELFRQEVDIVVVSRSFCCFFTLVDTRPGTWWMVHHLISWSAALTSASNVRHIMLVARPCSKA